MNGKSTTNGHSNGGSPGKYLLPLEDVARFHEDIMEMDVDVVKDTLLDYQDAGSTSLHELIEREVRLEPLEDDHPLHALPQSALHRAALVGSVPILSLMLHLPKVNINHAMSSNGYSPLHVAAAADVTPLVSFLAANGADVNLGARGGQTPLHVVARHGATDTAKILVVKGASVGSLDHENKSPLHIAAHRGHTGMISFLLKRGEEQGISGWQDCAGHTALHAAQIRGNVRSTELLIVANPSIISVQDQDGNTPLHVGLENFKEASEEELDSTSHINCIDQLLQAGSDPNSTNHAVNTPLHICAAHANLHAATLLIKHGAHLKAVNSAGQTPIFLLRSPQILQYFLELGADLLAISKNGDTALHMFSRAGIDVDLVTRLLSEEVCIDAQNSNGDTALHCACESGSAHKVTVLISSGANGEISNNCGNLPIQVALEHKHMEIVDLLFANLTLVNHQDKNGSTLLHLATEQDNLDLVQRLHNLHRANLNLMDKNKNNAASIAATNKSHQVLMYLLTNGAELTTFTEEPLHYFSAEGNKEVVQILHQQGHNINALNAAGESVLHCALLNKQWNTALYLLDNKSHANTYANNGTSPLHTAVETCRYVNLIAMLIDNAADVNAKSADGKSPLHIAMSCNTLEISMHLVDMGADVNSVDTDGNTPIHSALHFACCHLSNNTEQVETVRFLLESESTRVDVTTRNNLGKSAVHLAAELGQWELVRKLVDLGANVNDVDTVGFTPLMYACLSKNIRTVGVLLKSRASVNATDQHGETALYKAISSSTGNGVIDLLLQNEADPDIATSWGDTCLHASLGCGNFDAMELLLSHNATVDASDHAGVSVLHVASLTAPHDIVRILVEHGAKVQNTAKNGRCPLHCSVLNKDKSVVQYLIQQGADLEVSDNQGNTALHEAASIMSYDHVTCLLEEGVNVDATNKNGETALHLASSSKNETDVLELLISHEADVNIANSHGDTPFLISLSHGNISAATILLDYDADFDVCNAAGETALHKAVRLNNVRPAFLQSLTRRGLSPHQKNKEGKSPVDILLGLKRQDERILLHSLGVAEERI